MQLKGESSKQYRPSRQDVYKRQALVRANYRNVRKGVESDMSFLILFFRNLMIGENNELKNRTMIINAPQKLTEQVDRTSTEQVPNMLTEQLSAPLTAIIKVIGTEPVSYTHLDVYKRQEQTFALTESFIRLKLMLELLEGNKGSRNLKYFFQ